MNILDELGTIKRRQLPEVMCIDEYYAPSSGIGKYNCVLLDFSTKQIIDVLSDRTKRYLNLFFQKIPKKELNNVQMVSIDMWEPYKSISEMYLKKAKIAVDSFHDMKHINEMVDKIRKQIMRRYSTGDDEYYLLKKFNYLLLRNYNDLKYFEPKFNHRLCQYLNNHSTINLILKIDPILELAHTIKERYRRFNTDLTSNDKENELDEIILECKCSRTKEIIEVGKMLFNWKKEILNSFILYNGQRVSNCINSNNTFTK